VPAKRSHLCLLFIRTLLGEWDRIKPLSSSASDLEVERRLLFFERWAGETATISEKNMVMTPSRDKISTDATSGSDENGSFWGLMIAAGERAGLLVRTDDGDLVFGSRPLFEVLVAQDAIDRGYEASVIARADDDAWSEIIIDLIELRAEPDTLVGLLRPGGPGHMSRLRVFGRPLVECIERGMDCQVEVEAFTNLVRAEVVNGGQTDRTLCALAWRLQPRYWQDWAAKVLQADSEHLGVAVRFLAAVDLPDTIRLLQLQAAETPLETKQRVAEALGDTTSPEATSLLWSLVSDREITQSAIQQLIRRGKTAIDTAAHILNKDGALLDLKEAAIRVLSEAGDATALDILLRFAQSCNPQLHFLVWNTVYERHFARLGNTDGARTIDEMNARTIYARFGKRGLDLIVGITGFLVVIPTALIIALAIRITSPGPLLFRQDRIGKNGRAFTLYKFRTMYFDAESQTGPSWASKSDPRIVPLGRLLRKLRLDELPQLINVVRGDMSLVGPRPERPEFERILNETVPLAAERARVTPGITGLAQVEWEYGNTVDDVLRKLVFDLYYVSHCSFRMDLRIFIKTLRLTIWGEGAR
jgi:lipopolysaccharide/colanic/teichoic acid biosynthesis glycosyltransferase